MHSTASTTDNIFQILNLDCSYKSGTGNIVLKIAELGIPRNKLTFILGPSGGGKSTLLETLGLMNNTIASGKVIYSSGRSSGTIEFNELWKHKRFRQIQQIRKEDLGFIFQNTNLMESFTAYENVGLSMMIKNSVSQNEAREETIPIMQRLGLTYDKVDLNTPPLNLSGGQKQRLAFVRALASKSTVLLCDEPTGNLDEINAFELLKVLKESVKNHLTAIVVSHDIDLAMEHADQIVLITLNKDQKGEVVKESIFPSTYWKNNNECTPVEFKEKVLSQFNNGNTIEKTERPGDWKTGTNSLFNKYFNTLLFKRESKSLAGKKNINLFILPLIIYLSLMGVGFSSGCLDYLDSKMKSAFVNWVPINIPFNSSAGATISKLESEFLDNQSAKNHYQFNRTSKFKESLWWFRDKKSQEPVKFKGRTINLENDGKLLKEEILNSSNYLSGNSSGFTNEKEIGIIVSKKLLEDCNYDPDHTAFIVIDHAVYLPEKGAFIWIPVTVPVIAVVNEIPGKNQFCITEYFNRAWNQKFQDAFDIRFSTTLNIFSSLNNESTNAIYDKIQNLLGERIAYHSKSDLIKRNVEGYNLMFELKSVSNAFELDSIYNRLIKDPQLQKHAGKLTKFHSFSIINESFAPVSYDYISIYFNNLDSIRSFNQYLDLSFNQDKDAMSAIRMDESQVKEKENFNFLSKITFITSYLLILISALSVSLFIWKVINAHLEKVKPNIGTLTAIGLSENKSQRIYFYIIMVLLIVSSVIAFILALITGRVLNEMMHNNLSHAEQNNYFEIDHLNTMLLFVTIFVFALISAKISISKILSKTPGDLIYNRS